VRSWSDDLVYLPYPSLSSLEPSAHAVEPLEWWRSVHGSPRGSVRRPVLVQRVTISHGGGNLASWIANTTHQTAKMQGQWSSAITILVERKRKGLLEVPNDPLSFPVQFADLDLSIRQRCQCQDALGHELECVRGLENQCRYCRHMR
jgi:hypothetical protein